MWKGSSIDARASLFGSRAAWLFAIGLAACGSPAASVATDVSAGTDATADDSGDDSGACNCATAADCAGDPGECQTWQCVTCMCVGAPVSAGTACDDGKACNAGDTCDAMGHCIGGTNTVHGKSSDGTVEPCIVCLCSDNPDGSCAVLTTDIGAACDDNNICTHDDSCEPGGICTGVADLAPEATNTCYLNVCDPTTGVYHVQTAAGSDGAACDDGNACTTGELCAVGLCAGGTPTICAAGLACDVTLGCVP